MKAVRTGGSRGRGARRAKRASLSRPPRSLVRATVFGLTVTLIAGPFALTGKAASCSSLEPADWVEMEVPAFSEGAQSIFDYDVSTTDPHLLFVTNGRAVLSSTDAGCSFNEVFSLGGWAEDYVSEAAEITDLHLASNDGKTVYLAINARESLVLPDLEVLDQNPDLVDRPHVVVTTDGGNNWSTGDGGLDQIYGRPLSIAATPGSNTAYLLVDEPEMAKANLVAEQVKVKQGQTLWASTAGGSSWTKKQDLGGTYVEPANEAPPLWKGLHADPVDDQSFWIYGETNTAGSLRNSTDGGTTWATNVLGNGLFINGVEGVETYYPPGGPTEVVVIATGLPQVSFSSDAGLTYRAWPEPGQVQSAALTSAYSFAVATAEGEVHFTFPAVAEPLDISFREPIQDVKGVQYGATGLIYGRTGNTIVRRVAPKPPPIPKTTWPEPEPLPADFEFPHYDPEGEPPPPQLLPKAQTVTLLPGEKKTIPYQLMLPGAVAVDIAFLMDTSDSMSEEIAGLKESIDAIRTALREANIYAWAGVGQYKSFSGPPAYGLEKQIGPMDDEFDAAINRMNASGGNSETGLSALHSLATGEGRVARSGHIAAGQQMNFRPGILHFVVHGTDENPDPTPPNPSFQEVITALNNVPVRHIGLAYENSGYGPYLAPPPTGTLSVLATGTYATVPEGISVDCTGDGQYTDPRDLLPGEPLVCAIPSDRAGDGNSVGTAIADLVKSIPDLRSVTLKVPGDDGVLSAVNPPMHPQINFKVEQMVPFDVEVVCPVDTPDYAYEMTPTAVARGQTIAEAKLTVLCRAPEEDPFIRPPTGERNIAAGPLPIPPPPRPPHLNQPVLPQSPVQQVQAQQQAQQQMQAQAGLVPQRQEQPQVAAVKVMKPSANLARVDGGGGDDLSFSSYEPRRHGDPPLYLFTWVVGAAVGSAFGLVVRARARRRYVVARARNRDRARRTLRHWN